MLATRNEGEHAQIARQSSQLEKLLEYHFLTALGAELYRRGIDFSALRDDVDRHGRDVLIEASAHLRHIQLKSMVRGGKRGEITVNSQLAGKRSPCIIWYE